MSFILYANYIINPFLNSRISVKQDKVEGHSANDKIIFKKQHALINKLIIHELSQRMYYYIFATMKADSTVASLDVQ